MFEKIEQNEARIDETHSTSPRGETHPATPSAYDVADASPFDLREDEVLAATDVDERDFDPRMPTGRY